jgi:transposase-like protein
MILIRASGAVNTGLARHVEAQAESGLSVQDFCFAYGLPVRSFYPWRRRLNAKRPASPGEDTISWLAVHPLFAEVAVLSPELVSGACVSAESVSSESVAEVVLRGGRRLQGGADFDEAELRRLVALLESLPC